MAQSVSVNQPRGPGLDGDGTGSRTKSPEILGCFRTRSSCPSYAHPPAPTSETVTASGLPQPWAASTRHVLCSPPVSPRSAPVPLHVCQPLSASDPREAGAGGAQQSRSC